MDEENKRSSGHLLRMLLSGMALLALLGLLAYLLPLFMQVFHPQVNCETTLLATVSETVSAQGVLLFQESRIEGGGNLGYLVQDGERVSAGTAVAEIYTNSDQGDLRSQLTALDHQISLLQKSENTSSTQVDSLIKERTSAIYDLLDTLDRQTYPNTQSKKEAYLLAQNKLRITTGEVADFSEQIAQLNARRQEVLHALGDPAKLTSSQTGYFISAQSTRVLTVPSEELLSASPSVLKKKLEAGVDAPLSGCVGKVVSSFSWTYCGVCSAEDGKRMLLDTGKPIRSKIAISFPGQMDSSLAGQITDVQIDEAAGLAKVIVSCQLVNGDVLRLGQADATITLGIYSGLRIPENAIHYVKKEASADAEGANSAGESYIPGVYVKFGNIMRFRKIDPPDEAHPLVSEGGYRIVAPKGTSGSVSEVSLYDEVIVSGQNLYDGKLL